jgi:hypothetical protein
MHAAIMGSAAFFEPETLISPFKTHLLFIIKSDTLKLLLQNSLS